MFVVYTWRQYDEEKDVASSLHDRLVVRSEEDIRAYAKSPEAKAASERLRAHVARHGGEPSAEDLAEIPALSDEELAAMRPVKQQLTIRLDTDVLDWLKSKRGPYQTRLNGILRFVMLRERSGEAKSKARKRSSAV